MSDVASLTSDVSLWLEVAGQRLEARTWGPPPTEAPSVILLHEGLGSVAQWKTFPKDLSAATGWSVIAYSREGYGQSSPVSLPRPLDYMHREATEVLPRILDAFGVRDTVLLGHSDGASIAAIHAGRCHDARVRGLCLIAPHFFTEPEGLAAIAAARVAFGRGDLRERLAKYHSDPDGAFRGWNDAWLDPDFEAWTIEAVISDIEVATLVIQGREDPYGTLAQVEVLEERFSGTVDSLVLDACKHAPHLEHPEVTMKTLVGFLERVRAFSSSRLREG